MKNKPYKIFTLIAIGLSFYSFATMVHADITDDKVNEALKVLSEKLGEEITTKEQAAQKCDSTDVTILEICKAVGDQFNAYNKEEKRLADSFVTEVKASIADEIKNCETTECLIENAQKLADRFNKKSPDVASKLDLTKKIIDDKKAILDTIKNEGVSLEQCLGLDPNTAPIDTLRRCFNAQKKILGEQKFNTYVPEGFKNDKDFEDKSVELREGLANGSVDCGGAKSLDACGQYCLNPSPEARTQGTSTIPAVCRSIAQRFFGVEGVAHLEQAYSHVQETKDFHLQKYENLAFVTASGETLTNSKDIGAYCEEQGKNGNITEARKCLDFGKNNGFISEEEEEFAREFLEHANSKGDFKESFEKCVQNPDLDECQKFIPEKEKARFQKFKEIESIMKESFGFDPRECPNRDCSQGAEKALAQLETLNSQDPDIQRMITDMKKNLARAKRFSEHKDDLNTIFQEQGRCSTPEECHTYCSNPEHSAECIAAGSKTNIFEGEEAVRKYQELHQTTQGDFPGSSGEFSGRGPFPGFRPPEWGGQIPGQTEGFNNVPESYRISEECKRAIESGDFEGTKRLCDLRSQRISPGSTPGDYPKNDGDRKRMCHERGGTWKDGFCEFNPQEGERRDFTPSPWPSNGERPPQTPSFQPRPEGEFRPLIEGSSPPRSSVEPPPPGSGEQPPLSPPPTSGFLQLLRANLAGTIKSFKLW